MVIHLVYGFYGCMFKIMGYRTPKQVTLFRYPNGKRELYLRYTVPEVKDEGQGTGDKEDEEARH